MKRRLLRWFRQGPTPDEWFWLLIAPFLIALFTFAPLLLVWRLLCQSATH